jgi:tetratricopeptide (TPR) repeat protein
VRTVEHLKIRAVTELRGSGFDLYLEGMSKHWGMSLRGACLVVALASVGTSAPARAQATPDDAAGREYFERGRAAFELADYENALVYFRHAYRLSRRGELQYNIGVAADRLQREEEALEAFQHYLEETKDPTREAEVRERIEALQKTIAERKATELALEEATIRQRATNATSDGVRIPKPTIIGASALAAVGVAGVAAMGVGLAKNGTCKEEVAGECIVEQSATAWTWVYGGLGVAALAGSATWFAISAKRTKTKRETEISLTPTGLMVSGRF